MEWNWLYSLLYGLISGISEFLPVSSEAQRRLLYEVCGLSDPGPEMLLAVHLGCLVTVFFVCYSKLSKLLREKKLSSIPPRRRRRQPDAISLIELRLLKIGVAPLVLSCVSAYWLYGRSNNLLILSLFLCLNAILLLLPEHLQHSNKDARSLSPLDALLIGASGIFGVIPGISRVGTLLTCASARGADRQYILGFLHMMLIPIFAVLCVVDVALLISGAGGQFSSSVMIHGFLAFVGSVAASSAGVYFMRFLSVKIGYSAFAYYGFGLGLFTFILYLIG